MLTGNNDHCFPRTVVPSSSGSSSWTAGPCSWRQLVLWRISNYTPISVHVVCHPRILKSSVTLLWELLTSNSQQCVLSKKENVKETVLTFWHRIFTFNSNKSPTWSNNFSVYYPDVRIINWKTVASGWWFIWMVRWCNLKFYI